MTEALLAIVTGFAVGVLFTFLKLPIPAPPVFPGVMGIVGVFLGQEAFQMIVKQMAS